MLTILQVPHPILRQTSKPVGPIDTKVIDFIKQLESTLVHQDHPKGVGLSAPQVGKLWRVFVTYLPRPHPKIRIFINPEIISAAKKLTLGPDPKKPILEGCLSIPRIYGPVYRQEWVKLKYLTLPTGPGPAGLQGQALMKFSGFPARVVQHEMDHLNGILFTDRSLAAKLPLYEETGDQLIPLNLPDTPQ